MIVLLASIGLATTLQRPLAIEELAARSDAAVLGEVIAADVQAKQGRLWTKLLIDAEDGGHTVAWVPGGCLDGVCMDVLGAPKAGVGDRVFVFLSDGRVTGLAQGLFLVSGEEGVRELGGLTFREEADAPTRVPLAELREAAEDLLR